MSIIVIDPTENARVPFLRGILTRSLQNAGLSFTEAYEIANQIRKSLNADAEITTDDLSAIVIALLEEKNHEDALERYGKSPPPMPIQIIDRDEQPQPFSKGILAQSLEICAFPLGERYKITSAIEQQLLNDGATELSSTDLAALTHKYLLENDPPEMAHRYLVWLEFARSGKPMIWSWK